jgi:hypothetical protein
VGGLVGNNGGSVTTASASGRVNGSNGVGGLVGDNGGSIRDAVATGEVTGLVSVGGITGVNNDIVTDAYWDVEATGQSASAGSATGLSTAEMQGEAARENMPGLAFGSVWRTVPGDYPELIATAQNGTPPESSPEPEPETGPARFDENDDNEIQVEEVLDAIVAYNAESTVSGQPVTVTDVVDLIVAYNADEQVSGRA